MFGIGGGFGKWHTTTLAAVGKCTYTIPAGEIRSTSAAGKLQNNPVALEMYHSVEMRTTSGVQCSILVLSRCTLLLVLRCTPLLVLLICTVLLVSRCTILVVGGGLAQLIWCGLRNPQGQRPLPHKSITLFQPQPLTILALSSSPSPSYPSLPAPALTIQALSSSPSPS